MLSEGIPPPSRNHRTPTAADTPAAAAASSLERPAAIARQNRCRSSRRPTDGRPGDRIRDRPARSAARRRTAPIATLLIEALRGPLEFAQYTSLAFGKTLRESGLVASMGSRGDAFDNAACESCISTLKVEWIKRHRYESRDQARLSIFRYIETFYNPRRRHSSLGGISPDEFERRLQNRRQEQEIDTIETTRAA